MFQRDQGAEVLTFEPSNDLYSEACILVIKLLVRDDPVSDQEHSTFEIAVGIQFCPISVFTLCVSSQSSFFFTN